MPNVSAPCPPPPRGCLKNLLLPPWGANDSDESLPSEPMNDAQQLPLKAALSASFGHWALQPCPPPCRKGPPPPPRRCPRGGCHTESGFQGHRARLRPLTQPLRPLASHRPPPCFGGISGLPGWPPSVSLLCSSSASRTPRPVLIFLWERSQRRGREGKPRRVGWVSRVPVNVEKVPH